MNKYMNPSSNNINYTPLHKDYLSSSSNKNKASFLFFNASSFLMAALLISGIYLTNASKKATIINSQASEVKLRCPSPLPYPSVIQATTVNDNKIVDVRPGDKIDALQITFSWEPIEQAESYYVMLSKSNGINEVIDPIVHGTKTLKTKHTFFNLDPATTYHFFTRIRTKTGSYSMIYPTPGNCSNILPARSYFQFSTNP